MSTHRVIIVSDIHFPKHHKECWEAAKQFIQDMQPSLLIALGDIIDLSMLSKYSPNMDDPVVAANEIGFACNELNSLVPHTGRIIVVPGNHEDRWAKALFGNRAPQLKGTKGLTLEEQFRAQGLDPSIKWKEETEHDPCLEIGKQAVVVFHGHKQSVGWGVKHVAATNLVRFPDRSSVVGHHHRGQLQTRTSLGKTYVAIANPHLSGSHPYNITPDWQRGLTLLEFYGRSRLRDCTQFTPHLIIMDEEGRFAWNGEIYPKKIKTG